MAGIVAYFAAVFWGYDALVFAETRGEIDRMISDLGESELHPSAAVRKAFGLDSDMLYWRAGFDIYRHEFARRWDEVAYFHSHKIVATPIWAFLLWLWYDRQSVEALELRIWCCSIAGLRAVDDLSNAAFGKTLNDLDPNERDCVLRFYKMRFSRACPEIARFKHRAP